MFVSYITIKLVLRRKKTRGQRMPCFGPFGCPQAQGRPTEGAVHLEVGPRQLVETWREAGPGEGCAGEESPAVGNAAPRWWRIWGDGEDVP